MAAKTRDHLTDQLFKAILSLKSEEQCSNFFEDICTISELKSMAQLPMMVSWRWQDCSLVMWLCFHR